MTSLNKKSLHFSDHLTISVYTETDSSHFVAYHVMMSYDKAYYIHVTLWQYQYI